MNEYATAATQDTVKIEQIQVSAYAIPTATTEADGTLQWNSTTLVLTEITAAEKKGIGYTYANRAAADIIHHTLRPYLLGQNALNVTGLTERLIHQIRNDGNYGIAAMAVSAVDNALWDLKAKIFSVPLCCLLGQVRDKMLLYGSGGFTNYTDTQLATQFSSWAEQGIKYLKMKVGTEPEKDVTRVKGARTVIGDTIALFTDANGAYTVKQALEKAGEFSEFNVTWFEEPVRSDNLEGLHFIQQRAPARMNIAAGEYGYNLPYFQEMLQRRSVDILQADATRAGGITAFLKAGILAEAYQVPFSSHCAPALHLHPSLALPSFFIAEYFYDHVRIESMLFDGVTLPGDGYLCPDPSRPGLGIEFKHKDAAKYKL